MDCLEETFNVDALQIVIVGLGESREDSRTELDSSIHGKRGVNTQVESTLDWNGIDNHLVSVGNFLVADDVSTFERKHDVFSCNIVLLSNSEGIKACSIDEEL